MKSKWSANSSLHVGGRGGEAWLPGLEWGGGRGACFLCLLDFPISSPLDMASILIPLLLLLLLLLVAGVVFWYKRRVRG